MTSERDTHPDEGTIHAWLDRQLDDAASDALEAHLQRCDECAERVAEARGLIAGASRILAALDVDAPKAVAHATASTHEPAAAQRAAAEPRRSAILPTTRARGLPTFRLTPARSAIAAVLVVAVAMAIVHENERPSSKLASIAAESAAVASGAPAAAVAAPPATTAPTMAPVATPFDTTAGTRVAAARAFAKAQRETAVNADLARVGQVPAPQAASPTEQTVAAAKAADSLVTTLRAGVNGPPAMAMGAARGVAGGAARATAPASAAAGVEAPQCYRVESASGAAATWGPVALPFVLALDAPATRASARVLTAAGQDADARATFEHRGGDSIVFTLRRIGYSGTLAVGAPGEISAGVMRSAPAMSALNEVVVTTAPKATEQRRALRKSSATAPVRDDSVTTADREAAPAVPVVVSKVRCR